MCEEEDFSDDATAAFQNLEKDINEEDFENLLNLLL